MSTRIYVTINIPVVETMIQQQIDEGRAPSKSQAVEQLLLELYDLRKARAEMRTPQPSPVVNETPAIQTGAQPVDPERLEF